GQCRRTPLTAVGYAQAALAPPAAGGLRGAALRRACPPASGGPAVAAARRGAAGCSATPAAARAAAGPVPLAALFVRPRGLPGLATATEAAAAGAAGAGVFALLYRRLDLRRLGEVALETVKVTAMVFAILVGAALFSLVFRGYGGDDLVHRGLTSLPGGVLGAMLVVMALMFVLGFVLAFIDIVFVVVPIVAPVLLAMGVDPVWLGVM